MFISETYITELTSGEIQKMTDAKTKERAQDLTPKFVKLYNTGVLSFKTGKWHQKIKYDNKLFTGDVKVHCDCPSFTYHGWAYIMTKHNANLGEPENRKPVKTNPKLQGSVCKHVHAVLKTIPKIKNQILNVKK